MNTTEAQLILEPTVAYAIAPQPHGFSLSTYHKSAYPAVFCHLTGVSIDEVRPAYRYGSVMSFHVTPHFTPDPVLIYCPQEVEALKHYYKLWKACTKEIVIFGSYRMDAAIRHFVQTAKLTIDEKAFAVIEMLKFKNEVILR